VNNSNKFTKNFLKDAFFSKNVAFLIKSRKFNQKELADILEIGSTAISKWKSGEGFPNVNTLLNFAAFYEVKVDALFFTDLAQLKKDSIAPNFQYGENTKLKLEEQIRSMLERLEKLEKKVG